MRNITNTKTSIILEEKYHDSVAEVYNTRRIRDYIWEVPEEMFLLDKSFFKPRMNVVDMGCGPAVSVRKILGPVLSSLNYTGVDISKKLLKIARANIRSGTFVHGDMSSIPLPNNKFDVLLSLGALHHCDNKARTLNHWLKFVKPGGLLLLREPIYEFLKRGTGESPTEEGIKVQEFTRYVYKKRLKILRLTFFSTNAFHLFNRIMIKIGLESWQKVRVLWYPVVYIDSLLPRFSRYGNLFKPQSFAVILQKP